VTESGSIALIWNQDDPDPFSEADASPPTSIALGAVSVQSADGGSSGDAAILLAKAPYQGGGTLTLPAQDTFDIDILEATLFNSANDPIIFGRTIPVQLAGIQNTTIDIFVQRTGQFARLPSQLGAVPASPIALAIENQYVFVADGSGKQGATEDAIYDMNVWAPIESPPALPCAPLSIAPLGGTLILILCAPNTATAVGCDGGSSVIACGFDLSSIVLTQTLSDEGFPTGCGYADVAGGSTVLAPNGDSFIVGGTRPAPAVATNCVLRVGQAETTADAGFIPGSLTMGTFLATRQGAAAAWSAPYGLMIAGGNQSTSDPPVEYLGTGATELDSGVLPKSTPLHGYSVGDLAQGVGAAIVGAGNALVVAGGTLPDKSLAGIQIFNLQCAPEDCESEAGSDEGSEAGIEAGADAGDASGDEGDADAGATVLVSLASAQGFTVGASSALFVGASSAANGGVTQAFLVSTSISGTRVTGVTRVPLQLSQLTGTTAVVSPLSSVVVVGGDKTIESFVP
jgi:hypothetical protein